MKELIKVRRPNLSVDIQMEINEAFIADYNTKKYNAMFGAAEPETVDVMQQVLKKGDCAIDGGANVGYFSFIMAALVGDSGLVLAFEPGPDNVEKMRANMALNTSKQIRLIEQPLWDREEQVTLHMAQDSGQHALAPHETFGKVDMLATDIDKWEVIPKLIKLDVEGSEIKALSGGKTTILNHKPYIVCEMNQEALSHFGETQTGLREYVKEMFNYDTFLLLQKHPYPVFVHERVEVTTRQQNTNVLFATMDMIAKYFSEIRFE